MGSSNSSPSQTATTVKLVKPPPKAVPPTKEFSVDHPSNRRTSTPLISLNKNHPSFQKVKRLFLVGWKHPNKRKPEYFVIFKILYSSASLKPYVDYRNRVAQSVALQGNPDNPSNEMLLFHGTDRWCNVGENAEQVVLCDSEQCSVCCIIRGSFEVGRAGTKHSFRRFGAGIYTTTCSSKADDYVKNGNTPTEFRAMIASRVVVGIPDKRKENARHLASPPVGYHSVIGETGISLNYEETVVYDNDSIRPTYLIVYRDQPNKLKKAKSAFI